MTLQEELDDIDAKIKALEARRSEIFQASLDAPEAEKVIEDIWARMLANPGPKAKRTPWIVGDIAWGEAEMWDRRRAPEFKLVAVRVAGEKETHLGIYVGDLVTGAGANFHPASGVLTLKLGHYNPAILVPTLGRIVFGYESWWGEIKSEDDFKKITDQDIQNLWYVKALFGKVKAIDAQVQVPEKT